MSRRWKEEYEKKLRRSTCGKTDILMERLGCQTTYIKWKHLRKKKTTVT
jgi:hypothetical protein